MRGKPFPVILAAPSGVGKTTVARLLRDRRHDVVFSISATTRDPRPGELDGRDYWFVSRERFEEMRDAGEMVEWAEVHGKLYGTPRRNLEAAVTAGNHLLLDIDVQGAAQIRVAVPDAILVYLLPPSGEVLAARLLARGSESPDAWRYRMENALGELEAAERFDYVITNDELGATVSALECILEAESHRSVRRELLASEVERIAVEIRAHLGTGPGQGEEGGTASASADGTYKEST